MLQARLSIRADRELARLSTNRKLLEKINALILDACEHPFSGLGKPEPLKHQLKGFWSRRIDAKNRLIYRVAEPNLIIISLIGHYF